MADAHLRGKFPGIGDTVIISRDGYVLDGHHRWAALMTLDPARKMQVKVIDMDMDDLLAEAAATPGVYQADFEGDPLSKEDQEKYKKENQSRFRGKSAFVRAIHRLATQDPGFRVGLQKELRQLRARDGKDLRSLHERKAEFWQDVRSVLDRRWGRDAKVTERGLYRFLVLRKVGDQLFRYDFDGDEDGNFEVTVLRLDPEDKTGRRHHEARHVVRLGPSITALVDQAEMMTNQMA